MLSDSFSLALSLAAVAVAMRKATSKRTFGFRRIETIAAFLNGLALLIIPVIVVYEALGRFIRHTPISGREMLSVACLGLFINILVAFILAAGDKEHNLNLRSAFLHVFADIASSCGVIFASVMVLKFNMPVFDPIVSIVVSFVIFYGGVKVTAESFASLMEGVPRGFNSDDLKKQIMSLTKGEILDLKVWSIASNEDYAMVKIKIPLTASEQDVLEKLKQAFKEARLKANIQIEK